MTDPSLDARIPGLERLPRSIEPARDLWPGIHGRLRPRRRPGLPAWAGFAVAASLLALVVLPLRQGASPVAESTLSRVATPSESVAYYTGQLRVVQGAEAELLLALAVHPQSEALLRLLESTRQRQRELRRLATTHV